MIRSQGNPAQDDGRGRPRPSSHWDRAGSVLPGRSGDGGQSGILGAYVSPIRHRVLGAGVFLSGGPHPRGKALVRGAEGGRFRWDRRGGPGRHPAGWVADRWGRTRPATEGDAGQ